MRYGVFCGLLLGGLFLGRNFAEFYEMRHEGVLAKFAIARLYGHFGSRHLQQNVVLCLHFGSHGLQQNVVLCLHFKCIVITR